MLLIASPGPLGAVVALIRRNNVVLVCMSISGKIVQTTGRGAIAPERTHRVVERRHFRVDSRVLRGILK